MCFLRYHELRQQSPKSYFYHKNLSQGQRTRIIDLYDTWTLETASLRIGMHTKFEDSIYHGSKVMLKIIVDNKQTDGQDKYSPIIFNQGNN